MKQVALEVLLFKYVVSQIVAFMCRLADDNPDWQLLQWIAWCLRGAQWEINNAYEFLDILNNTDDSMTLDEIRMKYGSRSVNHKSKQYV